MRILIGSCGGLTGFFLTKHFKKMGNIVYGTDFCFPNATSQFLDKEFTICKFDDDSFIEVVIDILLKYKIDCYLPTHSKEIRAISKNEQYIRKKWKGFLIVSPYKTYIALDDKKAANQNLKKIGVPVPKMITSILAENKYPIFVKPLSGSGSRNSQIITSPSMHAEYLKETSNFVFFEFVKGKEYTVDCFFDENGHLIAYNPRIRRKCIGGAVVVSENDYSFDIYPYLKMIAEHFAIKGCVNFQYIIKDGIPYFIDVNLRYASGGLPLSVKSGVDVFEFLTNLYNKRELSFRKLDMSQNGLTMFRYFDEWYSQ